MANPDHVRKLTELDKDKWRDWRRENPNPVPDLSNLDHDARLDESGYPESPRDLAGYDLSHANLRGANLMKANLSRADFSGCDLRNAKFELANLRGANFKDAKCFGTEFDGANLEGATLINTRLEGASMQRVRLSPDLGSIESLVIPNSATTVARDVESLLSRLKEINRALVDGGDKNEVQIYFRGEKDHVYKLRPHVMRECKMQVNEDSLERDLSISRPEDISESSLYFQRLVLAAHYGLPTRLLDLTRNPLVGLRYACDEADWSRDGILHMFLVPGHAVRPFDSDTVSLAANFVRLSGMEKTALLGRAARMIPIADVEDPDSCVDYIEFDEDSYGQAQKRLHHFIAREKPYWEPRINLLDLFRVLIVEPQCQFDRLRAHSGAFMLSAFHERFERWAVDKHFPGAAPYHHMRFVVPHDSKDGIRQQLESLNITEEVLMADLQSAASAIKARVLG